MVHVHKKHVSQRSCFLQLTSATLSVSVLGSVSEQSAVQDA